MQISPIQGTANMNLMSGYPSLTTGSSLDQKSPKRIAQSTTVSENSYTVQKSTVDLQFQGLRALPPKASPLQSNRASSFTLTPPSQTVPSPPSVPIQSSSSSPQTSIDQSQTSQDQPQTSHDQPKPSNSDHPPNTNPSNPPPKTKSWAQRAKPIADRSLKRLAPTTLSDIGVPQVLVPGEVFERGEELHRDFIIGAFFAKMPSYKAIESVLNFLWGKGTKLEIHTNAKERTMIVRIPNEYIRSKVLEKRIWYVGTAMFHVAQWSTQQPVATPDLLSIPIWAHLKGLPLNLRSQEGLSFAAGLVGDPKETDEYTKNLSNIDVAHVKVHADLTSPLPPVIELKRQNGDVIPVTVEYPWSPPSCSFCQQIGHIQKDCLLYKPEWVPTDKNKEKNQATSPNNTEPSSSDSSNQEKENEADPPPSAP